MKIYTPGQIVAGLSRRMKAAFATDPNRYLEKCRGVIHVGANDGGERKLYARYSLPVLWVEALPHVFPILIENLREFPAQRAVNALLTDKEGETYDFHVSNNSGVSSSIYEFQDHKELWPDTVFSETIRLRGTTLASLMEAQGAAAGDYDALVLDVQGAELLVLKGAGAFLKQIRFVRAEVSDFESYRGACTVDTLSPALKEWGFKVRRKDCFASKKGVGSYFDILYERKG